MRVCFSLLVCLAIGLLLNSNAIAQSSSTVTKKITKDIVDTAVESGKFETLVKAITAAELAETLKSKGPFTVFAPSDEAFKKIPEAKLKEILKPENRSKLQSLLKLHVVSGKVMAAEVVKMTKAKTAQGQEISIKTEEGTVMINGAKVVKADIECKNGVIHVIDTVIMPMMKEKGSNSRTASGSNDKN